MQADVQSLTTAFISLAETPVRGGVNLLLVPQTKQNL
jgi:hypothetical protein